MNIQAVVIAAVSSTLITSNLSAQVNEQRDSSAKMARWELVVPSGAVIPTGAQRDAIKRGNLTAVQLMFIARPTFAITSTFGWARSRDIASAGSPKLDVFTYDAGAELRAPRWLSSKTTTFSPFAGVGVGGRSYDYRKLAVAATHNVASYASVGGEVGLKRVRIRLEARDYVSGFKPLASGGSARTSNDVVIMVGLRLVSR